MSSQPQLQLQKSQPYQPTSGNGTRPQPLLVDQDPLTIYQRLYCANSAISESLNILSSNHNTIACLTRTCTTYQQRLEEWFKAYTALEVKHKKTSTDLENMTRNHHSVSPQLDEAGRSYESTVQEYGRELQVALGHRPSQNMNQGEMREYNNELTAAKKELNEMREMKREYQSGLREARGQLNTAQQNLDKLRKEKEDLIREHRDALGAAEDRAAIAMKRIIELEKQQSNELILRNRAMELEREVESIREQREALVEEWEAAEKRIAELNEEKADLIQEHRDALATAEDRAMVVAERIAELENEKELENMHLTAESGASAAESPVASPETIPSPNTRKRPRFESKQDDVQQQHRKVRGRKVAKAINEDTIIVETE